LAQFSGRQLEIIGEGQQVCHRLGHQFLGLKFAATRVVLTTTFVAGMAYLVDAIVRHHETKKLTVKTPTEDPSE